MIISGEKIKNIRLQQGMSRAELSRRSDVPVRTLEDWEAGKRDPRDVDVVVQVAQALHVDVAMLYSDKYLSSLNAQALTNMDIFSDCEENEQDLICRIDNIYARYGAKGLAKLLDRFISHTGIETALKIVEEYMDENCTD